MTDTQNPKVSVIVPVYNVEEYIGRMLESLKNQRFKDFEVLIINDGSTDNSQSIIDKFVQSDQRFKSFQKKNGGVASARNRGIKEAQGEYIVFYDPDDFVPQNALYAMYKKGKKNNADMVVGVMVEVSLGEKLIYMNSQKLAQNKKILPIDRHFFSAWSLCHKMFKREFIIENSLYIEDMKNAEDGVFTFTALNCDPKIVGCNTVAYNYNKRPFWLTASATQTISEEYLDGLLASHDRILFEAKNLADKYFNTKEEKKAYLEPLYIRFIEGEMINGYYRGMWRSETDLVPKINKRMTMYKEQISEKAWQKLVSRHKDIDISRGFIPFDKLKEKPIVSIIIDERYVKEADMVENSIYNQLFPRFEIIRSSDILCAVKKAKGIYLMIIKDDILFTKNTLKSLVANLHRSNSDFASMYVRYFDGEEFHDIKSIRAAFGYLPRAREKCTKMTENDVIISNKLIKKDALKMHIEKGIDIDEILTGNYLYKYLRCYKVTKGSMILTDLGILNAKVGIYGEFHFRKNKFIKNSIEKAKRFITKEDIEKLKEKIKM